MKLIFGIITLAIFASFAIAQQAPKTESAATITNLWAARSSTAIKNSPFSGEEINESVQILGDGNRIVRSSTGKIYRNNEGSVRRDTTGGMNNGLFGSLYTTGSGVSITSAATGLGAFSPRVSTTAEGKIVQMMRKKDDTENPGALSEERTIVISGLKVTPDATRAGIVDQNGLTARLFAAPFTGQFEYSTKPDLSSKYDTRTEELGTRDFEGVSAEGTRKITTIPAGAIGNERAIETIYERWYSKELGMVVYSKNTDPRFGEQTYRLSNLIRAEPDPSLFNRLTTIRKIDPLAPLPRISRTPATPVIKSTANAKSLPVNAVVKTKP
ncbi:MAG: hypothetical protein WKF34_01765 [Pyrinomonadaceae bacterium]